AGGDGLALTRALKRRPPRRRARDRRGAPAVRGGGRATTTSHRPGAGWHNLVMARARLDEDAARNLRCSSAGARPAHHLARRAGRVTARGPHRGPPPTGARARAPKRRGADNARVIG